MSSSLIRMREATSARGIAVGLASCLLLGTGLTVPAYALELDEQELVDLSLEELLNVDVTTASLLPQAAQVAPATTYVVTDRTIQMRGYTTLLELLEDIPEVQTQHNAQVDALHYVTLRGVGGGIGNEKFVILIDGQRLSPASGDWYPLGRQFSLANARQVEVIMGPASALYGADAFAGVINIVTKKGSELDGGQVSLGYGQYGTYDLSLALGSDLGELPGLDERFEKAEVSLTGHMYHSDEPFWPDFYPDEYAWYTNNYSSTGAVRVSPFAPPEVTREIDIKPFEQPQDAMFLHARVNLGDLEIGHVRTSEGHSSSIGMRPEFSVYWEEARMKVDIDNTYASHSYKAVDERLELRTMLSAQRHSIDPRSAFINSFSGYDTGYKYGSTRTLSLSEQLVVKVTEKTPLIVGFSVADFTTVPRTDNLPAPYDRDSSPQDQGFYYQGTDVMDASGESLRLAQDVHFLQYQNFGGFAQIQVAELDKVTLTAGARYDHNTRYGGSLNPRAALVVEPTEQLQAKLLYGEAYLAPSPYKSYLAYGSFFPETDMDGNVTGLRSGFLFRPNPDLEPEKLRSVEGSVSFEPLKGVRLAANGYFIDITNLIAPGVPEFGADFKGVPVDVLQRNVNTGDARTYGGTAQADVLWNVGPVQLGPRVAYTYSDGEAGEDDGPLMHNSKHTVRAGVDVRANLGPGYLAVSPRMLYRSKSRTPVTDEGGNPMVVDGYATLDVVARYTWQPSPAMSASAFVRVDNATDSRYYSAHQGLADSFGAIPQDPIRVVTGLTASF